MSGGGLSAVLAAVEAGASTPGAVATRCGLPLDVVEVALDQLVRLGRLSSTALVPGCPDTGCGTCPTGCSSWLGLPQRGAPRSSSRRSARAWAAVRGDDPVASA